MLLANSTILLFVTTSQSVAYVTVTISLIKSIAVKVDDQISG